MSIIDELKERSRQRSRGAVPLERESPGDAAPAALDPDPDPVPAPAAAPSGSPGSPGYCAFWIERIESVRGLSPTVAAAAVRDAIRAAAPPHRPPEDDARLFAAAGGQALPYGDVAAWLRLRDAAPDAPRTLDPAVARFWRDRLGPPPPVAVGGAGAADWSARCRATALEASRVGRELDPATVAALAAHPDAAPGYLRCAASPAHRTPSTAADLAADLAADPAADPAADSEPPPAGREQVADDPPPARSPPLAPPTSGPTAFSAPVATSVSPGVGPGVGSGVAGVSSRVGLALGGLVGGLAGGAVDGFGAGLAKLRARPVTSDQPSSDQPSSASAGARNPPGDPGLRRAAREAERALADFAEAARELDDHPRLAAFWREVDRQAAARFDGARDGVLREMASHRRHPLHLLFERHASADPDVALHHRRALDAFSRLQVAWEACALAHRDRGERWAPAPEMSDALRAACRRTPPALGQPAPIDRAEQLLRALAQAIREAWSRPGGRAPSPGGPSPGGPAP